MSSETYENSVIEEIEDLEEYEVEKILDSKKIKGLQHYHIRWKGFSKDEDTWEPAINIIDKELIRDFNAKKSKGKKRSVKSEGSKSKVRKEKGGSKRVSAKQLTEEARANSIKARKGISIKKSSLSHKAVPKEFCCLICAARLYSQAMEAELKTPIPKHKVKLVEEIMKSKDPLPTGNKLLDSLLKAPSEVPAFTRGAFPDDYSSNALTIAIKANRADWVALLLKYEDNRADPPQSALEPPNSGTGYVSKNTFGHAIATVNESRGNREGNNAFYKSVLNDPMQLNHRKTYQFADVRSLSLLTALDDFKFKLEDLDSHINLTNCNIYYGTTDFVYELAARGKRAILAHLIEREQNDGYNHLYLEVLKYVNGESLTSYRSNQITKKAINHRQLQPLHLAAINPKSDYLSEFFNSLVTAELSGVDGFGRNVAHFAAVSETSACLEFLVEKKFDVNSFDQQKVTPVMLAAMHGKTHNFPVFLEALGSEAFSAKQYSKGWTLLHYAAHYGHIDSVNWLVKHIPLDTQDKDSKASALHHACKMGHFECVKILIDAGAESEIVNKFGCSSLHLAAKNGRFDIVQYLLVECGVDCNAKDTSDNTPLHYAAAYGWLEIVNLLILVGADVNAFNIWKTTPLAIADSKGHVAVANHLLENRKVDANFKNKEGMNLLHTYVISNPNNWYDANRLIAKAQKLVSRDNIVLATGDMNDNTPLHLLAGSNFYVKSDTELPKEPPTFWQLKNEYDEKVKSNELYGEFHDDHGTQIQIELANICVQIGCDINFKNKDGYTPLACAMDAGHIDMVKYLLDTNKVDIVPSITQHGDNILHFILNQFAVYQAEIKQNEGVDSIESRRIKRLQTKLEGLLNSLFSGHYDFQLKIIANSPNSKGFTPVMQGVLEVYNQQKNKKDLHDLNTDKFNKETNLKNLDFQYDYFTEALEKFIDRCSIDVNVQVPYPEDYFTKDKKPKPESEPEFTGWSPLQFSCKIKEPELVKILLKHGGDPNQFNFGYRDGRTPLIIASEFKEDPSDWEHFNSKWSGKFNIVYTPSYVKWVSVLDQLLEVGGDLFIMPNFVNNYKSETPVNGKYNSSSIGSILQDIKETDLVLMLTKLKLKLGEELSTKLSMPYNHSGSTPLMAAVELNRIDILKTLLTNRMDINFCDKEGDTVLMQAIKKSNPEAINLILSGSFEFLTNLDLSVINKMGESILTLIGQHNCANSYKLIPPFLTSFTQINHQDSFGKSALFWACQHGKTEVVQALVRNNANVNLPCTPPSSSISTIKENGISPLMVAIKYYSDSTLDIVKSLVGHGAQVNFTDHQLSTALHYAVISQDHKVVQFLLGSGIQVNSKDKYQLTPLHFAVKGTLAQVDKTLRIERLLIEYGADINATDYQGRTPLHLCFSILHTIPYMNYTCKFIKLSKEAKEFVEKESSRDTNIKGLFNELEIKDQWFTNFLSENKILPPMREEIKPLQEEYSVNWFNNSPFRLLKFEESYSFVKEDPIDLIRYFLTLEAIKVDEKDVFGRTPMHYSSRVGAYTCTKYLIERGANLNSLDLDHNSPFHVGLLYGHLDYSNLLLNMGADVLSPLTLNTGRQITPFYRSLEKSFMPLAYLIIDQKIGFLKAFHDTLISGKLHLAATLLSRTTSHHVLSIDQKSDRNILHILADVTPIDRRSWKDYLVDFLNVIDKFNVSSDVVDNENFTPLCIAAKHCQSELCQILIERNSNSKYLNQVTKCGKTALWQAIRSNDITTAKMLLKRNVDLNNVDTSKNPSLLHIAVSHSPALVEELINNGAAVDEDVLFGRSSIFVLSLITNPFDSIDQRIEFWKLLLRKGANINTPAAVAKHLIDPKKGQSTDMKETVLIHPAFLAIKLCIKEKKFLFEHGLRCNVKHPISGQFLVKSIDDVDTLELLLKKEINLNSRDVVTNRPFIYELIIGNHKLLESKKILFWDSIWNSGIQLDLSSVDPVTNQTPLEYALRANDLPLFSHLLNHGANPYIHSCLIAEDVSVVRNSTDAIGHALNLNRPEYLQVLMEYADRTCTWANWNQTDPQGRTSLFYIIAPNQSTFYNNFEVLQNIVLKLNAAGVSVNEIESIRDQLGFSCLDFAAMSQDLEVYEGMVKLGFTAFSQPDLDRLQKDTTFDSLAIRLNVNLPKVEVDKDAELGRKYLEDLLAAKPKKETKQSDPLKDVDPNSDLMGIGQIALGHEQEPLSVTMNRTEMVSMYYSRNLFYVLQLIYNPLTSVYVLFTRWGSIGEKGMFQRTPLADYEKGVKEFENVFKAKSGNSWANRAEEKFEAKDGRYIISKTFKPKPMAPMRELIEKSSPVQSVLPENTKNLMRLFTHLSSMNKLNKDAHADLPLGFLSNDTIKEGRRILDQLRATLDDYSKCVYSSNPVSSKEQANKRMRIIKLNSLYFTTIPKLSQDLNNIKPLTNMNTLTEEMTRLNTIQYLNSGANILLASHAKLDTMNPLDYCFSALNRSFTEIPNHHPEYNLVYDFIGSGVEQYDLVQLIRLEQPTEFDTKFKDTTRKLLWHGSSLSNFVGILSQGLRVAPVEANATGYMFGKGIYFGDAFAKSISYASTYSNLDCGYSCLLVSEVAVGKSRPHLHSHYYGEVPEGYESVLGMGRNQPNPDKIKYTSNGCEIPSNELVPVDLGTVPLVDETYNAYYDCNLLNYNEYIVYEPERVKMVYLVLVKDKYKCHLCDNTGSVSSFTSYLNLDRTQFKDKFPPKTSKFNSILDNTFFNCNLFEIFLAEGLFHLKGLDLHAFVQSYVSHYILDQRKYTTRPEWSPVTPLTRSTKLCTSCFRQCIGIAADFYLRDNRSLLPTPVRALETCWYGRSCRNQNKELHFAKFWHGAENSKDSNGKIESNGSNQPVDPVSDDDKEEEEEEEDYFSPEEGTDGDNSEEDVFYSD